jgi:hypothetical protein
LDVAPYLIEYAARRHIALHSYAFVEALADVVCEEKWLYTTWWVVPEEMTFGILILEFSILKYFSC